MNDMGLATNGDYALPAVVLTCWQSFIDQVEGADLSKKTRLDGWTVRDVAVHLGTWDGASSLSASIATRGTQEANTPVSPDQVNADLIAAHRDASDEEIIAALRASMEEVRELFRSVYDDHGPASPEAFEPVASQLGPIPLLTLVHAGCYELALHALDIADATGGDADPLLLHFGVAALADTTGCLAAREGIAASIVIDAEDSPWSFTSHAHGGWTTTEVEGKAHGPRVSGSAEDLLEASAGRADPVRLLTLRHLKVKHIGGLLALTPIIDQVPGLPGGRGLKSAAKTVGSLFNR